MYSVWSQICLILVLFVCLLSIKVQRMLGKLHQQTSKGKQRANYASFQEMRRFAAMISH